MIGGSGVRPNESGEVRLALANSGSRRKVEEVVTVERGERQLSTSKDSAWLIPGSWQRYQLPFRPGGEAVGRGDARLVIVARDAGTGELLCSLGGALGGGAK